jgi:hypothetical protein
VLAIERCRFRNIKSTGRCIFRIIEPEADMKGIRRRQPDRTIRQFVTVKAEYLIEKDRTQRFEMIRATPYSSACRSD